MKELLKNLLWSSQNANTFTMNLSGAPAAPVSFIVRVSAKTSLGQQFQLNKKGEF